MAHSKTENKDFALKLVIMEASNLLRVAQAIRRDDYTNEELAGIIKKYQREAR